MRLKLAANPLAVPSQSPWTGMKAWPCFGWIAGGVGRARGVEAAGAAAEVALAITAARSATIRIAAAADGHRCLSRRASIGPPSRSRPHCAKLAQPYLF